MAQSTVSGWGAEALYRPSASISIPLGYQRLSTQDDETQESLPGAVKSLWRAAIQGTGASLTWSLEYAATNRDDPGQDGGVVNSTVINAALAWRDEIFGSGAGQPAGGESAGPDYETVEGYPMRGRSWYAEVKVGW